MRYRLRLKLLVLFFSFLFNNFPRNIIEFIFESFSLSTIYCFERVVLSKPTAATDI